MNDWTEQDRRLLAAYWPVHSTREIWWRLGKRHSESSIDIKAKQMRLARPAGFPSLRDEVMAALAERPTAPAYRPGGRDV